MQSFNKVTCRQLRSDLNTILAKYGKENGVVFDLGNMRFTDNEVKITSFTARTKDTPKRTEIALGNMFSRHGLKELNHKGDRLVEYNSRRHTYPFVYVEANTNKRFKCSLAQCKRLGFEVL